MCLTIELFQSASQYMGGWTLNSGGWIDRGGNYVRYRIILTEWIFGVINYDNLMLVGHNGGSIIDSEKNSIRNCLLAKRSDQGWF